MAKRIREILTKYLHTASLRGTDLVWHPTPVKPRRWPRRGQPCAALAHLGYHIKPKAYLPQLHYLEPEIATK